MTETYDLELPEETLFEVEGEKPCVLAGAGFNEEKDSYWVRHEIVNHPAVEAWEIGESGFNNFQNTQTGLKFMRRAVKAMGLPPGERNLGTQVGKLYYWVNFTPADPENGRDYDNYQIRRKMSYDEISEIRTEAPQQEAVDEDEIPF